MCMSRRIRATPFDDDVEMFRLLKAGEEASDNKALLRSATRAVRKVITDELTSRQKEYIVLYYYKEMDMSEIAEMYNVNKSTVSRTINRARNNIIKYTKYYMK